MGQNSRVCSGSSPQLESEFLSFCSLKAWGWEEGPGPKTPDSDRPDRLCTHRALLRVSGVGFPEQPGDLRELPVALCVCPPSTPSCVLISFPF